VATREEALNGKKAMMRTNKHASLGFYGSYLRGIERTGDALVFAIIELRMQSLKMAQDRKKKEARR